MIAHRSFSTAAAAKAAAATTVAVILAETVLPHSVRAEHATPPVGGQCAALLVNGWNER
jgi:hypothetical protein